MPLLFGEPCYLHCNASRGAGQLSPAEEGFGSVLRRAWANFARTGSPVDGSEMPTDDDGAGVLGVSPGRGGTSVDGGGDDDMLKEWPRFWNATPVGQADGLLSMSVGGSRSAHYSDEGDPCTSIWAKAPGWQ